MAVMKCGHSVLCICDDEKANEISSLLSDNDNTQIGGDEGELQDKCDTSEGSNNRAKEITTRKRSISEKDGTDLRKKKK